jgi:Nucleotidyl transferase AbiEii toxin, Type IV TA system
MSTSPRTPPRTHQMLSRWAEVYGRQVGQDAARVRRWVAYMALGSALSRDSPEGAPRFALKGGVALELRLRERARATRDLDLVLNDHAGELLERLREALAGGFEQFAFHLHEGARALRPDTVRAEVSVGYGGKSWARVPVDLSRCEAGLFEVEMVDTLAFGDLSFGFPTALPCLSLHLQAAQKLHAMTLPPSGGRQNTRFRDLLDLVLLTELIDDLPAFREACLGVFAHRGTHPWPPPIDVPLQWVQPYRALAEEVGVAGTDAADAALRIRSFLHRLEVSALPLAPARDPASPHGASC